MGKSYSTDHIARDHIHTDITCNTKEPQKKNRLGTVSYRLFGGGGGGGGVKLVLPDSNLAICFHYSSTQPNNYHKFNRPTYNCKSLKICGIKISRFYKNSIHVF